MTIAAAYLVSEGVVFGADSSSTVFLQTPHGERGVAQFLHHSQKVFEVGENSRIGVCTYGAASLGKVSHRTAVAMLADKISEKTGVKEAAEMFTEIVAKEIRDTGHEDVGYYIGGWNPDTHEPECHQIQLRGDNDPLKEHSQLETGLCSFSGASNFFTRVFYGFDPDLKTNLLDNLKHSFPEQEDIDQLLDNAFEKACRPLAAAGYRDIPLREAIDFVYSYLHITVKALKFKIGAPVCGGPIEVGFVSTDRKFRWARHKTFTSALVEQEGDYEIQ